MDQVATAINEVTYAVQEVAKNAEQASQAAAAADNEAREGDTVVNQAIDQIEALAGQVGEGAKVIERLAQQSEQIEVVLTVIHGIAEVRVFSSVA